MATRKSSMIVKLRLPQQSAGNKPPTTSASAKSASAQSSALPSIPDILTQFTKSHLILALTLQKSKPEDLSIKGYCEELQTHVKSGSIILPGPQRYVDTVEFWKEQCGKIHQENRALEDKVRCVEESSRLLRQALRRNEDTRDSEKSVESPEPNNCGRSNLRKRLSSALQEDFQEEEAAPILTSPLADDDLLRLSSYVLQLKRQRTKLEEACQVSNTIDQITFLTRETICMLALLQTPFFECCLPFFSLKMNASQTYTTSMIQRVITHVGVSFLACFKAFNELCRTIPGRAKKSELVFHLVMVFSKSLGFLKTFSDLQADEQALVRSGRSHKRVRVEQGEFAINKYLSKMLSSVAYGIEWKVQQPGHSDLLEGMLFSVLEHTGRLLSESVFEEHVAASDDPGNISKGRPRRFNEASRIEARYIVQILHATLGGYERKGLVAQILSSGRTPAGQSRLNSTNGDVLSGDVLLKAKKLLQSTLMKTAVGGEELETLRLPTPPLETTEVVVAKRPVVERYGADWVVETIWALIGWDLMD